MAAACEMLEVCAVQNCQRVQKTIWHLGLGGGGLMQGEFARPKHGKNFRAEFVEVHDDGVREADEEKGRCMMS